MEEDKNCRPWDKPYYFVAEAAAYWCNVTGRKIHLDEKGLPLADSQNPCLRSRAEWIMDAIDCGELPCGRDGGPSLEEHVAKPRRTVRRSDLRQWFLEHQGEKPPFLFDDTERNTHPAINADSFRALQADLQAEKARHEKTTERLREMTSHLSSIKNERDALQGMMEKMASADAANPRKEKSDLHIIGAMLDIVMEKNSFNSEEELRRYVAEKYAGYAGCAERTLAGRFAEAKKLLSE